MAARTRSEDTQNSFLPPLWILTIFFVLLLGWLVVELKEIVTLLVLGYCVAYVLEPVLEWSDKKRIGRSVSIPLVFIALLALIACLVLTVFPVLGAQLLELARRIPSALISLQAKVDPMLARVNSLLPDTVPQLDLSVILGGLGSLINPDTVGGIARTAGKALLSGYSLTLTIVNLALLPFIVYYLSLDFVPSHWRALRWFPRPWRAKLRDIALEIDQSLGAFVKGQFIVASILSLLYAIGLGIIGVELWPVLALISGFGNIVPYLGTILGITLSSLLALLSFGDFIHVLFVWGVFALVQLLEGTFITPKIVGDKVGLSPLSVILAIVAAGTLLGLLGVLLAVPLAAIFKVLFRQLYDWVLAKVPE